MMRYSVQPSDRIFVKVKGYGFLFFAKKMSKNIGKNMSKNLAVYIAKSSLIIQNNPQKVLLKLLQKDKFKKQKKQQVI